VTFTFGDVTQTPVVAGGPPAKDGDGVEIGCSDPGPLWNKAVDSWKAMRKRGY
jgi:hypothetical protein